MARRSNHPVKFATCGIVQIQSILLRKTQTSVTIEKSGV